MALEQLDDALRLLLGLRRVARIGVYVYAVGNPEPLALARVPLEFRIDRGGVLDRKSVV